MTVAGTAQDFHLIPFYAWEKLPGITKTAAKVHIIFLSAKKKQEKRSEERDGDNEARTTRIACIQLDVTLQAAG